MKKKWINLKRRWRKIGKGDRIFYRGQAIVIAFNLLILLFTWTAVFSLFWVGLLAYVYSMELARRRVCQWIYYYKGRWRQIDLDNVKLARAASLRLQYDMLKSDHNKLQCDYHRLKKSINPKNKKRNEQQSKH